MVYLSSSTSIPEQYKWDKFGLMLSSVRQIGGQWEALEQGALWMMDSGCYSNKLNIAQWKSMMEKLSNFSKTCIGIPCPDVVGDAKKTTEMFHDMSYHISRLGLPVAYVSQDGIEDVDIPWGKLDVIFIGGTDAHKLGPEAGRVINAALSNDKHVHVGRVNSKKRLNMFDMCHSADGTMLSWAAGKQREQRAHMIAECIAKIRSK